jgi:hypothetical protein
VAEPRRARRPQPAPERGREERWQAPPRPRGVDAAALLVLVDALRRAVPRELEAQLTTLLRELLLTLRSLIDWYLERLDGGPREPDVEEIPID